MQQNYIYLNGRLYFFSRSSIKKNRGYLKVANKLQLCTVINTLFMYKLLIESKNRILESIKLQCINTYRGKIN